MRFVRQTPPEKKDPEERFKDASAQAEQKPEWGEGENGYMRPQNAAEKLRKNMPYKVRYSIFETFPF